MLRSPLRSAALTAVVVGALSTSYVGVAAAADPTPSPAADQSASPAASPSPAGPAPSYLAVTASAGTVTYGGTLTLTGGLTRGDGSPIADASVQVLSRTAGQDSRVVLATVRTDSGGRLSYVLTPRVTAEYQLRYDGDGVTAASVSNPTASDLRPRINGAFTPAGVKLGQPSVLRGSIAPAYSGSRLAIRRRAADGSWAAVAVVGIDGSGGYAWPVKPGLVGRYVFQVVLPAQPAHLAAATPAMAVQVDPRDLVQGDRGGDVLTLERRLAAQKTDVGRVDGVFDYDLTHAVMAFQKSQGIARTGRYDGATRVRLGAPVPVRLRYPKSGRAVEIDLRKQVLYLSEGGVLRRILDVSTGSGQLYVSDGVTDRAVTPRGSFRVERKIDGVRISRLGALYRPAYFYGGYAIHGSGSVPPYPASHGCVRITNPAMDRLFSLLTIGTPVSVYAG